MMVHKSSNSMFNDFIFWIHILPPIMIIFFVNRKCS